LHRRIEWAHPGLIAVHKATIDVDDQIAILFVKRLQHVELSFRGAVTAEEPLIHANSYTSQTALRSACRCQRQGDCFGAQNDTGNQCIRSA
jgi:hypothetical protein